MAVEDTVSPRVLAKMVYSGTTAVSFAKASRDLANLSNLAISDERVRRACGHVGGDRVNPQQPLQEAFQSKPLPQQSHGKPADVEPPEIACGRKFAQPPPDASDDDPGKILRGSRVYYENHACRMDYPSYRCSGFPLTSGLMESMVKQVRRRVKGTEQYWSAPGGEAIPRLSGEYPSDGEPMCTYWDQRSRHAPGVRAYRPKRSLVYN